MKKSSVVSELMPLSARVGGPGNYPWSDFGLGGEEEEEEDENDEKNEDEGEE